MSDASAIPTSVRRHDLDALRAGAMLLGIGLHAALSFHPAPWPVQDRNATEWFGLFTAAVHGFRMPLFFLLSGYFTMMLYRKRGGRGLLAQRAARILAPCLLGLVTIVPVVGMVSAWAMRTATPRDAIEAESLVKAVRAGNRAGVDAALADGTDPNLADGYFGITPLAWASLQGSDEIVELLIERGAQVDARNRDGSTPLHCAAFRGWDLVVARLLERHADPRATNQSGQAPLESAAADADVTSYIDRLLGLAARPPEELAEGRKRARDVLSQATGVSTPATDDSRDAASAGSGRLMHRYRAWIGSERFRVSVGDRSFHLVDTDLFAHLWFLWYLWWLAVLFVVVATVAERLGVPRLGDSAVLSAARFVWLVPLTCVPLWFMFPLGPDTSPGLVPPPHILAYYAIFFGFGACYFDADDQTGRLGRSWKWLLPASMFLIFPAVLVTAPSPGAHAVAQACYAWGMSCGLIGLARSALSSERPAIRYLSDASYWLYLAHLPLVMAAQAIVRDWSLPALAKFALVNVVVTLLLLVSYHWLVRKTWIGWLLNGPKRQAAN